MTVDTTTVYGNQTDNPSIKKRDRRDVIRQVREITGFDDNAINQTIEACKDDAGRYSVEQVINLLFDDNLRNNLPQPNLTHKQSHTNPDVSVQGATAALSPQTNDRDHGYALTDDIIEMSAEIDNHQSADYDDDLERALILSRETIEQMIDESDISERKSFDEPVGLKNIGNTCWFNSIVQALYTLPYFRQFILNFRYSPLNRALTDSEQQAIAFTEELRYLFILMLKSPRRSINPDRAIKKFRNTRKLSGIDFSHEDCSEFATHLVDLVELAYETVGENLIGVNNPTATTVNNPMHALVTGEILVERNNHNSIREALRQINIQMVDSSNLYDGLESLWLGSADESQQTIDEQRWLTRLPPVLFICLNRYRFSQTTKQASKIMTPFEFESELYLDRYLYINKDLISHKRNLARTLYANLHDLEHTLNSYLKYPCNNQSFSLANALRVVYEYATGRRLNPVLLKRSDSALSDADPPRVQSTVPIQPSHISNEELQFIQNTIPTWLTEVEGKCSNIREEIRHLQNELKQLYDAFQLKQVRYTLHAVCVHEGSATLGHFWTYVYHTDRQKWYRYNDNDVTESKWSDVCEAGIGGLHTQNDREAPRVPSAYLLIYINNEQKTLSNDIQYEFTADLQRILDDDLTLLQQQIEIVRLEQLHNNLKVISDRSERSEGVDKVLSLPFFSGNNASSELVKPVTDSTIRILKAYESKILSTDTDHLLREIVDKEIKSYASTIHIIKTALPYVDYRLQHILSYFSANRMDMIYQQRAMYDIIRLLPIAHDDIRLRIFKQQAQIIYNSMSMSTDKVQEYQKMLNDYKDFRSVIAAFLAGHQLMNENKFEDAITYFCVACEYNLRLSKQFTLPMKAMDSSVLFKTRGLCFEKWNENLIHRFITDPTLRLETITEQFLSCLMQLKVSLEDDQFYINEIQRSWYLLLDKIQPEERLVSLEKLLQRLAEPPIDQHSHSVSINKNQLVERYEEAVRDLFYRHPTFRSARREQQSPIRSNRTMHSTASVQIPIAVYQPPQHQQRSARQHQTDPHRLSPMQQSDEEQESLLPP